MPDSPALLLTVQLLKESEDPRVGRKLSNPLVQWFRSSDPWGHFGNMGRRSIFDCHND